MSGSGGPDPVDRLGSGAESYPAPRAVDFVPADEADALVRQIQEDLAVLRVEVAEAEQAARQAEESASIYDRGLIERATGAHESAIRALRNRWEAGPDERVIDLRTGLPAAPQPSPQPPAPPTGPAAPGQVAADSRTDGADGEIGAPTPVVPAPAWTTPAPAASAPPPPPPPMGAQPPSGVVVPNETLRLVVSMLRTTALIVIMVVVIVFALAFTAR